MHLHLDLDSFVWRNEMKETKERGLFSRLTAIGEQVNGMGKTWQIEWLANVIIHIDTIQQKKRIEEKLREKEKQEIDNLAFQFTEKENTILINLAAVHPKIVDIMEKIAIFYSDINFILKRDE